MSFEIIPAIDLRDGRCVRLQQGDYQRQTTYATAPVDVARQWADAGARLIHLVDLDGAKAGHPCNLPTVAAICAAVNVPCELGGGIRDLATARQALEAGVARVILGTTLAERPELAGELLATLTPEQVVGGLDARNGRIAVRGWLQEAALNVVDLASRLFTLGLRRFIYTDISVDGMFTGPHVAGTDQLCAALPAARIIASGGVGATVHVTDLVRLQRGNLEGVIVGKALYDGRVTYADLRAVAGA